MSNTNPWKGLITYVKYQSPSIYHTKVIAKFKVFNAYDKHGTKFTRSIFLVPTDLKALSQRTLKWNVKALVPTKQKI
jgi:hypothetical protein